MVFSGLTNAATLEINSAILELGGVSTTSNSYGNALSINATEGGDYLVLGTFSTRGSSGFLGLGGGTGFWQLEGGGQNSTAIQRSMDNVFENGIASVNHVFTGLAPGSTINLQHRSSPGSQTIFTRGANLVAIPLTTSEGENLNYGIGQQSSPSQNSSSTFSATNLNTSVQVNRSSGNSIYFAASFNTEALTTAGTGTWRLEYKEQNSATWIPTGSQIRRSMSNTSDIGAATLFAVENGLAAGTYEARLVSRVDAGTTVETLNGTLTAVALSYDNGNGGGYFETFSFSGADLADNGNIQAGPGYDITLEEDAGIFAATNFTSDGGSTVGFLGENGTYAITLDETTSNQESQRYFANGTDTGAGASIAYFDGLSAGDYTLAATRSSNVGGSDVTLVGFSTESVPEPATTALLFAQACALFTLGRRRKRTNTDQIIERRRRSLSYDAASSSRA